VAGNIWQALGLGNTGEEKKAARDKKFEVKPLGPKPPGCYTLFMVVPHTADSPTLSLWSRYPT